jgi:hypothetical protein
MEITMSRFSYVKYDQESVELQNRFKAKFEEIETYLAVLPEGRAKSLVMTKLEEAYMWVGKAIRDEQAKHRTVEEQPERKTD